jgi:hypothetical protein
MQARQAAACLVQLRFTEHFFDARKHFILFETHMVVKKLTDARELFRWDRLFGGEPLLELEHCRANLGVIGEQPHHVRILVDACVSRIRGQKHFFLLAKMHFPRFVPEAHKFLRLPHGSPGSFLDWSFRRAAHFEGLNQRKVMMLAERMQTRMAFHASMRDGKFDESAV